MSGQIVTILLIAVVLGMDAFSLALAMGLRGTEGRSYEYKFAASVTLFHILMPLLGLYLGYSAGQILGMWASILGASVLGYVGISFIMEGYKEVKVQNLTFEQGQRLLEENEKDKKYAGKNMLLLTASVSMDALATGFSLGTTGVPVLFTVIIMGITAGVMTLGGFRGGKILGSMAGSYAQIVGGAVLIILAVKILF